MFQRATPRLCALGLLILGLLSTGCANQRAWPSGFLTHNADLQATGHGDDVAYVRPDINWKAYQYAYIEPASIRPTRPGAVDATLRQQAELTAYLHEATAHAFGNRFTIVDKPGANAVRIREAITEVGQASPWVNIPAALIAYPIDYGGVTVEMEILDATTGRRLCALMASRTGNPLQLAEHFTWLGHARRGVDRCTEQLRLTVDESVNAPPAPAAGEMAYVP
jgi:hypothetical protein